MRIGTADAVFEAAVESIERRPGAPAGSRLQERHVRLHDVRVWRGDETDVVMTGMGGGDCGYHFRVGTRYLIEAYRRPSDGRLETGICSHTRPIDEAAGFLAYLESLSRPSTGGRLWGSVTTWSMALGTARALEHAQVRVHGASEHTATIGPSGRFMFEALPPGRYTISVELPPGRPELLAIREQALALDGAYACAEVTLGAAVNGRIAGTVVDASGRPMRGVAVMLGSARQPAPPGSGMLLTITDASGRYVFERVGPGPYVVGVSIVSGPSPAGLDVAYARYDGKEEIELAPGAELTLDPIVARRVERFIVQGSVVASTGETVAGIEVWAAALGWQGPLEASASTKTDANGDFTMNLWRGMRYRVSVGPRPRAGHSRDIVAGDEPILITLPPQ